MISDLLVVLVISSATWALLQCLVFSCILDGRLESVVEQYIKNNPGNKETAHFQANRRLNKFGATFFTKTVGYIEVIFFGFITFSLIKLIPADRLLFGKDLLEIVAGWLAIKTLGNYQQWSGPILGRAVFYKFLIGTVTIIAGGIVSGLFSLYLLGLH